MNTMISKERFIAIASHLYDAMSAENVEQTSIPFDEKKKLICNYRAKNGFVRLTHIAEHYRVDLALIRKICHDLKLQEVRYGGRSGFIAKEDCELLVLVIAKSYDNFNS